MCLPGVNSKSARVLLMLVVPGHLVFLYAVSLLQGEEAPITAAFTVCYLCAALLQVNPFNPSTTEKNSHFVARELLMNSPTLSSP